MNDSSRADAGSSREPIEKLAEAFSTSLSLAGRTSTITAAGTSASRTATTTDSPMIMKSNLIAHWM